MRTAGLGRSHGGVDALGAVDLRVRAGTGFGVLGSAGAGKTTLVDLLSTRLRPTRGSATVCGVDIVADPAAVRARIGVPTPVPDARLSGRDTLVLLARLRGTGPAAARRRVDDLVAAFDLGGAAMLGAPDVVVLDEPTAGLDPECRTALWTILGDLTGTGTAVLFTTRRLDEVDRLADDVAVLARGTVVAAGTPGQLTARLGRRPATGVLPGLRPLAEDALLRAGLAPGGTGATTVAAPIEPIELIDDVDLLLGALDAADVALLDRTVVDPTIDEVFRSLCDAGLRDQVLRGRAAG